MDKIRRGIFGICEQCQRPIPLDRLRAMPYAELCMDCQKKVEDTVKSVRLAAEQRRIDQQYQNELRAAQRQNGSPRKPRGDN